MQDVPRAGAPVVDDAFSVISHPIRRQLIEQLARSERRVTDLAAGMPVSRPAISQHLRVMLDVGIVTERRDGRERHYALRRDRLRDIDRWLRRLDKFWEDRLHRLGEHLDAQS